MVALSGETKTMPIPDLLSLGFCSFSTCLLVRE
jgi:hypothetical protein